MLIGPGKWVFLSLSLCLHFCIWERGHLNWLEMAYCVLINGKWGQVGQPPSLGGLKTWPRKLWGSLWAQLALHVHSLLVYVQNVVSSYHSVITLSHCVAAPLRPVIVAPWQQGSVGPTRPWAEGVDGFQHGFSFLSFFHLFVCYIIGPSNKLLL